MGNDMFEKIYREKTTLFLLSIGLFLESRREDILRNSDWEETAVIVRRLSSLFQENSLQEIVSLMRYFADLEPDEFTVLVQRLELPFSDTSI